ncbi:MAG: hypothetical protein FJ264_08810 [Planctomycetes bacterium]|nr:hypothetical protein [Planctomycetota bacterium]
MTRPWRIEFEGAYYHVLSRGNERCGIFADDIDCISFLEILGKITRRFEVEIYAYILLDNHYHLLLKTNKPNLSRAMQWFGTGAFPIFCNIQSRMGEAPAHPSK